MGKLIQYLGIAGIVTGAALGSQLGHVAEMYGARAQAHKFEAVKVANGQWKQFAEGNGYQWDDTSPVEGLRAISDHYTVLARHTAERLDVPLYTRDEEGIQLPQDELRDESRKLDYQSVAGHLQTAEATSYLAGRITTLDGVVKAMDETENNLIGRVGVVVRRYDREIMSETLDNYTPAISANNETLVGVGTGAATGGAGFGLLGLALSYLIGLPKKVYQERKKRK